MFVFLASDIYNGRRLAMKLETHRSFPSELQSLIAAATARLSVSRAVEQLWARDHRLWKQDPTDSTTRLGWLTIIEYMKDRTEELRTLFNHTAYQRKAHQ